MYGEVDLTIVPILLRSWGCPARSRAVPWLAGFGVALVDPDGAGCQRPESSKSKSTITIKKMIRSKIKIRRMMRFAPRVAAIKQNVEPTLR